MKYWPEWEVDGRKICEPWCEIKVLTTLEILGFGPNTGVLPGSRMFTDNLIEHLMDERFLLKSSAVILHACEPFNILQGSEEEDEEESEG